MIWGIILGVIIRQETLQFEIYIFWRFLIGRNEQSQKITNCDHNFTTQHNFVFEGGHNFTTQHNFVFARGHNFTTQHNFFFKPILQL